jgi:hypothetical protein
VEFLRRLQRCGLYHCPTGGFALLHDACCVVRTPITVHWLLITDYSSFIPQPSSFNSHHSIEFITSRRIEVGGHLADDVIGHALCAKPIVCTPPIALQGSCEERIEPHSHAGDMQLMGQINRISAIPPLIVRRVENDASIGLQVNTGAAFHFGKDRITIMRILAVCLKLRAHIIRSDDDRVDPIGVGLRPMAFARTG